MKKSPNGGEKLVILSYYHGRIRKKKHVNKQKQPQLMFLGLDLAHQ